MKKVLIADDKASLREMLVQTMEEKGYDVVSAKDGNEAVVHAAAGVDLVITDLRMPGLDGLEVLRAVKRVSPETEVIVMTAFGTVENAVEAMREGAYDYVLKPFSINEVELKAERALDRNRLASEVAYLKEQEDSRAGSMIGTGAAMQQVHHLINKVAPSNAPVLILGESGTGKELVAREIHRCGPRSGASFIAVNCAALSEGVLESELFGHEKGAYTGAAGARKGRFELADGGTLFLDEIGELSPQVQVKLLRFLQEKEIERVGGSKPIRVDTRIIAATHRNLKTAIVDGGFREDLYYRLNVIPIELPPLRDRLDDVPELAQHFLDKYAREMGKAMTLEAEATDRLMHFGWPGNIRELQNVIERAVVLSESDALTLADLPMDLSPFAAPESGGQSVQATPVSATSHYTPPERSTTDSGEPLTDLTARLEALEKGMISEALERFRWNQTKVASALGLKRSSLQYKLKKYCLTGNNE